MTKWINIDEKQPSFYEPVFILRPEYKNDIPNFIGMLIAEKSWVIDKETYAFDITHWMPILLDRSKVLEELQKDAKENDMGY